MNHSLRTLASVLLGAAALAALTTGCQRDPFSNNPNYNPEKNSVLTKFVLNINSQQGGGDTKMTAENVQANNNNFLGMQDVHILTYKLGPGNTPSFSGAPATTATPPVVGKFYFEPYSAGKATEDYNFGRLFDANTIVTSGANEKQSRVMELSFPLETNAVLLYGKALNTQGPENQGKVIAKGNPENLASLSFSLAPRVDKTVPSEYKAYTAGAYALQSILSSLTIAGLVDEQHYWTTDGKAKTTGEGGNSYQITGTENKQYKIWLPYEPNDKLYKAIANRFVKSDSTTPYEDNETYVPIEGDPTGSPYTYKLKIGNCSWKMLGDMYEAKHDGSSTTDPDAISNACGGNGLSFVPLLEALGEAYYKLLTISERVEELDEWVDPEDHDKGKKTITYHELRAGSAAAILRTMRDLDFILDKVLEATPTGWEEAIAQQLASEIHSRLELYFTGDKDNMLYRPAKTIREKIASYTNTQTGSDYDISGIATYFTDEYVKGTGTAFDGTDGFPMNIGFPMGAAYLETDVKGDGDAPWYFKAPRFLFKEDIPAYAFGTNETFNIFDYCYPAEIMYFGNSPLRVSTSEHAEKDYPKKLEDWRNDDEWGLDWTKFGSVTSETKSVAMVNHINYGSALLKSTVVYGSGFTKLKDNNKAIHPGEEDNEIDISGVDGLYVTGIVIGGQPKSVTWDFTRMPDSAGIDSETGAPLPPSYQGVTFTNGKFNNLFFTKNPFGMMIYDKVAEADRFRIGDTDVEENNENIVYTLCWDNYDATKTAAEQDNVYIALELQNKTGQDFWGETNLVRKDAIFYLVGKLDLAKIRTENTSANYGRIAGHLGDRSKNGEYYYPPFNPETGETIEVPRVFMQDYVTEATLILKQDALKHAYMSVPDLRSNQVSLGVSVDIKWETGLSFEVEMGRLN